MSAKHYALWLLLPDEAHSRYGAIIEAIARQYGTPRFEPHITLLGELTGEEQTLAQQTQALAREIEPFELRLLEAKYENEYYRCLYVLVAPSRALLRARERARERFARRIETAYVPHLSLVYGALAEEQKEKILEHTGRYFDETLRIGEIGLYAIEGSPEQWCCTVRVPLGGSGEECI